MSHAHITGKTIKEESTAGKSFDLPEWIRARRLQWLGHILRMGTERTLKQAVFIMFKAKQPGDLLMDAPETSSWRESYVRTRKTASTGECVSEP